jgi:hypothetical protein
MIPSLMDFLLDNSDLVRYSQSINFVLDTIDYRSFTIRLVGWVRVLCYLVRCNYPYKPSVPTSFSTTSK